MDISDLDFHEQHHNFSRTRHKRLLIGLGRRCAYCGSGENLTIDHLVPRSKGGQDHPSNLVLACLTCNNRKGSKDLSTWADKIGATLEDILSQRYFYGEFVCSEIPIYADKLRRY